MDNKVHDIFDGIRAENSLKEKTARYLYTELQKRERPGNKLKFAAAFASLAIIILFGGFSVYFTADAYIDIDINPSFELTVNHFNRVIDIIPYNDDAEKLLKDTNIRHISCDKAIERLLDLMSESGYLNQNALLSVTVQAKDNKMENALLGVVSSTIALSMQAHHQSTQTDVYIVSAEVKENAHKNHVTPAKYLAITELQKVDATADFEKCKNHTVSELISLRAQHGSGHHGSASDNTQDNIQQNEEYDTEEALNEHSGNENQNNDSATHNKNQNKHGGTNGHH